MSRSRLVREPRPRHDGVNLVAGYHECAYQETIVALSLRLEPCLASNPLICLNCLALADAAQARVISSAPSRSVVGCYRLMATALPVRYGPTMVSFDPPLLAAIAFVVTLGAKDKLPTQV